MTDGQEINRLKLEVKSLKQQLYHDNVKYRIEYEKEIALVREDAQIEILRLEKRSNELRELLRETVKELSNAKDLNKSHQKLNGQLQVKLSKYEDKAAHYRRKAVL